MSDTREISAIAGDRTCLGCGFNLTGQPIVREETYNLLIARCPECGTVAPLQEYPALGKWAGRFAAVLAAAVTLVLIGVILIGSLALYGGARAVSSEAQQQLSLSIASSYFDDVADTVLEGGSVTLQPDLNVEALIYQAQGEIDGTTTAAPTPFPGAVQQATPQTQRDATTLTTEGVDLGRSRFVGRWAQIDDGWWENQSHADILADYGGVTDALLQVSPAAWFGLCVFSFLYAMFLSVLMFHRRRTGLLLVGLVPLAITVAFMFIWPPKPSNWFGMWGVQAHSLAESVLWPYVATTTILFAAVFAALGFIFGRTVARWVLTLLLPVRMRSALAVLWSCDGRKLPRP